jgi:hypothetical protein
MRILIVILFCVSCATANKASNDTTTKNKLTWSQPVRLAVTVNRQVDMTVLDAVQKYLTLKKIRVMSDAEYTAMARDVIQRDMKNNKAPEMMELMMKASVPIAAMNLYASPSSEKVDSLGISVGTYDPRSKVRIPRLVLVNHSNMNRIDFIKAGIDSCIALKIFK